jgi:two-component system response regulator
MNNEIIEILLVEDNMNDAELTMRVLRRIKGASFINVTHLKDGEEAINYFFSDNEEYKQPAKFPKLILLDLKLPKVDGIQVLKKLKSNDHTKYIPVVIFTSSSEEKDIIESYKLGVNSYVTKPVGYEAFMEAVANLELYWVLLNQSPNIS